MIVLSAGLPKAGSGLIFNLTNDLLEQAGFNGIRQLRDDYNLQELLQHHNCNIGEPGWAALRRLLPLHFRGNRFVVKTHQGPNHTVRWLLRFGTLRVTYIFRDPRDVVLSAMDHGRRLRAEGKTHTFAHCYAVEDTIPRVLKWLRETTGWLEMPHTLCLKYEDLIASPLPVMQKLSVFLGIDAKLNGIDLKAMYSVYDVQNNHQADSTGLHWNKGVAGRYREALSPANLERCNREFREYLEILGYGE